MAERVDFIARPVAWRSTDAPVFVYAARVDEVWWVLRRNGFPDHPLYTLFVAGAVAGDVQDLRTTAPAWDLAVADRPSLTGEERDEVLTSLRGLGPYGSEVGQPCDGDWCPCALLTDEYIRGETTTAG